MESLNKEPNDPTLALSPSWIPPSPRSYHQIMDFLEGPVVESQNQDKGSTPAINETLISLPESLAIQPDTLLQQQPYCTSHEVLQQSDDQQDILTPEMVKSILEPNDFTMQQQQQLVYISQGNLPNSGSDEQYLSSQNGMNSFQNPNDTTMIGIGQQIEEEHRGFAAHPTMIPSSELPNNFQEQFNASVTLSSSNNQSHPTYQHGPDASHFNMYNQQQPPPLVLANRENEPLIPMTGTGLARTYVPPNDTSMSPYLNQMPSSFSRTYPQTVTTSVPQLLSSSTRTYLPQNQMVMNSSLPQMSSDFTRTYAQQNRTSSRSQMPSNSTRTNGRQNDQNPSRPQMQSNSIRENGNVQEAINEPSPTLTNPQVTTFVPIRPRLTSFTVPIQGSILGRRPRSYQTQYVHGESSSAAQRRRVMSSTAPNPGEERLVNKVYDPNYESLGLCLDPHLRNLSMYF